jgi:uncharacterized membrane protein YgdD (TMEM256/DUF423 family)
MKTLNRGGRRWLVIGALLAALAVGLGAFGAHGLEKFLAERVQDPARSVENWTTASRYQMYHATGMIAVAITIAVFGASPALNLANVLFVTGIVLFSGCLYVLALTDLKILGAIVPLGGLAMIAGWLSLAIGIMAKRPD